MRGLTWQQSLEWYFSSLYWWSLELSVFSTLWHMEGHWRSTSFSWSFPMFEWGELLWISGFVMALSQNAVFEHSMHFQYRFLDCKAQIKAYALFIRKWQIVCNRHSSKHMLRRSTVLRLQKVTLQHQVIGNYTACNSLVTRNHAVKSLCVNLFSSCICVCVYSYKVTFTPIGILKYNFFNLWVLFRGCEV